MQNSSELKQLHFKVKTVNSASNFYVSKSHLKKKKKHLEILHHLDLGSDPLSQMSSLGICTQHWEPLCQVPAQGGDVAADHVFH